jgi:hypothetical protein
LSRTSLMIEAVSVLGFVSCRAISHTHTHARARARVGLRELQRNAVSTGDQRTFAASAGRTFDQFEVTVLRLR